MIKTMNFTVFESHLMVHFRELRAKEIYVYLIFLTRMLAFFFMGARPSLVRFTPNILGNKTETALKKYYSGH